MKQCKKCLKVQPLKNYGNKAASKDKLQPYCKECQKAASRDWYVKNAERRSRVAKTWRDNNPDKVFRYDLKAKYGITVEEYNRLLESQGGVCAICGQTCYKNRLSVDHDHATGEVRGLLCDNCNKALGCFKEDPLVIKKALNYLVQ
jgi:hypothetical protein